MQAVQATCEFHASLCVCVAFTGRAGVARAPLGALIRAVMYMLMYVSVYVLCCTCMQVVLEWSVPHWVRSDDVQCSFTCEGLRVKVSSVMDVSRTFWAPK